ncbi:MAG: glycosyltransferase family 4 protein [Planctomycetes bacterium]|nr:glycosyltransferase family 4 protein [Planctomycetota bacterium]
MATLIHVTHEAYEKMGGIGAVLEGLLTARAYQSIVDRTILIGAAALPLRQPSEELAAVLYETGRQPCDPRLATGTAQAANSPAVPALAEALRKIEAASGARLLYGRRAVPCPLETRHSEVELLLVDVRDAKPAAFNHVKGQLYEAYGLQSDRYEREWGFEEWVRAAGPALDAVEALLAGALDDAVLVSHEFMGLPTLLAARLRMPGLRTVYWAHEVPTVRDLLENHTEHRLVFDQALETRRGVRSYEAVLKERGGFKYALVSRAHAAHRVFAVSSRIAQELELLSPDFRRTAVEIVYNGLPVRPIELEARVGSRDVLARYCEAVAGFRPDFVFTHVARPVASKAIERDLVVLEHLDDILAERGQTAVLLILATDGGRRDPDLVRRMEAEYGWPLHHRVGWPDLVKGEVPIGQAVEQYNEWGRVTRAVLINQFGFSRQSAGGRVPEGMSFQDLRQGSDVEFGQSAYEPFGIAQLETLAFGGISVLSRVCGCAQLLVRVAGDAMPENVLLADYRQSPGDAGEALDQTGARRAEHDVAARLAKDLAARLPTTREALARLLESGWAVAEKMSWQAVCREYFVPALERCLGRPIRRRAAGAVRGLEAAASGAERQLTARN